MKNFVGFVRDHSGSMFGFRKQAAADYNSNVHDLKEGSMASGLDTVVSVVECGGSISTVVANVPVHNLERLTTSGYRAQGGTPLFDAVGKLIDMFENTPDINDPDVSFLIMIITDGEENQSVRWKNRLKGKIQELTKTDRWTFVWRVPLNYKAQLVMEFGIPEGNVFEWDTNDTSGGSFERATVVTSAGVQNYYSGLKAGVRSTKKFFKVDVNPKTMKKAIAAGDLDDVSSQVNIVACHGEQEISPFVSTYFNKPYKRGCAYYQLTKKETIQPRKKIAVRDLSNGKVFAGDQARDLLGLPDGEYITIAPGHKAGFEIFVQSGSVNRKLMDKQQVLVWWPV